jgi:cellulose synthase/poly-beta-1,6-N-acetylglucosamine synthase-like glycosyltransferase
VVIPAQNEELTIRRCLRSVLDSFSWSPRGGRVWVVVVADACTDNTVDIARVELGEDGEVIECGVRSPGSARRIGAAAVIQHFRQVDPRHLWIANTDADSHVPVNWLDIHLLQAENNTTVVAGIVQLDRAGLLPGVQTLYDQTYELRADGTHGHVHGANLGVRGDAYMDAGGWSDLTVAEDHCLWRRLLQNGWSAVSIVSSSVTTSARLNGRAVGGFADTLRREVGEVPKHDAY